MPVDIKRISVDDFEELKDVVQDSQSEIVQLGRGPMSGTIHHFELSETSVAAGDFNRAMRASGTLSPSRWALGGLTRANHPATGHGHELRPGDLFIAAPNVERHFNFENNSAYVVALIAQDDIEKHLAAHPGAFDMLLKKHRLSILRSTSTEAQNNITGWNLMVDILMRDGLTMSDEMMAYHRDSMLRALLSPIREATPYRENHLPSPDKVARNIIDFLDHRKLPISNEELARHFGVGQRTMERAVTNYIDMGPSEYHLKKRLSRAHTMLRHDGPITVKQIGREFGFSDPSRFARMCKNQFGVLPRKTLKR